MADFIFAELDKWVLQTERRMKAVVRGATDRVMDIAQTPEAKGGRMPVDTGFLRNSLVSSVNGGGTAKGASSYALIAGTMDAGDIATFGWTADYARRLNGGFTGQDKLGRTYNQAGRHWLEGAAAQWPAIVAAETLKAKAAAR